MREDLSVSRRGLLLGLTAAGAAGSLIGVGTAAFMRDRIDIPGNRFTAGELDISGEWVDGDDAVSLDLTGIAAGETRAGTVEVALTGNPAWLWFGSTCPNPEAGIEDALYAQVYVDEDCDGSRTPLFADATTLREVLEVLSDGTMLTTGPMQPGGAVCLEFRVTMPSDLNGVKRNDLSGDTVRVEFSFLAEQQRHNADFTNPFAGTDCGGTVTPGGDCVCTVLGRYEIPQDEAIAVGDELVLVDGEDEATAYSLRVDAVTRADDADDGSELVGVAATLVGPESRLVCAVDVKAGQTTDTLVVSPPAASFEVDPLGNGQALSTLVVSVCEGGA